MSGWDLGPISDPLLPIRPIRGHIMWVSPPFFSPVPFSHLSLPLWFSFSYSLLWDFSYPALQERDSLFVWQQSRLPLPPLFSRVRSEVAGSGRRVKHYTKVRSEVFCLDGNGVRGYMCTKPFVKSGGGSADSELWRSDMLRTHLSLRQFNVGMCMRVGGFLEADEENRFLFWTFRWHQKANQTQDPVLLLY